MLHKVFAIRDSKGECYNQPFFQKTHGEAERSFKTLVNDPKSTVAQYPEDFDLYFLGEYDDQKGQLIALDTAQHVTKAVAVQQKAIN